MKSKQMAMSMWRAADDFPRMRIHGKPWKYSYINKRMRRSAERMIGRVKR